MLKVTIYDYLTNDRELDGQTVRESKAEGGERKNNCGILW